MLAVRAAGISKRFGVVSALDDVSLEVEKGTIHAVVGENGAGKTTLMRILYGALQPDQGQLTLAGEPTNFHSSADAIAAFEQAADALADVVVEDGGLALHLVPPCLRIHSIPVVTANA